MVSNSLTRLLPQKGIATASLAAALWLPAAANAADPVTDQRLANIDGRLTRLEGVLDNKVLLDMLQRIEAMQQELQATRDAADLVAHELEGLKDRQRELYLDIDRRLRALETARLDPAASGEAPPPHISDGPIDSILMPSEPTADSEDTVGGEPPPPAPGGRRESDSDAYRKAFNVLKGGRYEESIVAFSQFLADYPKSTYAANAQYWLAEASYVSGDYARAAKEFNDVIKQYPNSSKVPDAQLKLGFTLYELEQWEQARQVLSELNQRYPSTTVAQLAENRLDRMDREGH
jgi:tol-pal system protein YbgF